MRITLLCNAGLALEYENQVLLIDVPNQTAPPYSVLPDEEWNKIMNREKPYDRVCGFFLTHSHSDHCDPEKLAQYQNRWPQIPCYLPNEETKSGTILMGPFVISYHRIEHAPMDEQVPPHVVCWIRVGDKSLYIAADAKLDPSEHWKCIRGRVANAAFWNAMYLSRRETRQLMSQTAAANYIYHMPAVEPDNYGIWKKCRNNMMRYGEELHNVTIMHPNPYQIEI